MVYVNICFSLRGYIFKHGLSIKQVERITFFFLLLLFLFTRIKANI